MGFFKRFEPGQGTEDVMQTPPEGYEIPVNAEAQQHEPAPAEKGDRVRRPVEHPR